MQRCKASSPPPSTDSLQPRRFRLASHLKISRWHGDPRIRTSGDSSARRAGRPTLGRSLFTPAPDRQRSRMTPLRQFYTEPVESWAPDWKTKEGQATANARAKAARLPFGSAQGRKAATKATLE